jgi:hypothetical protein
MEETQLSTIASSAFEKANLIHNALETLRAAQRLDERDDLTAAIWMAWYDATIPDVRDIKILAGAMEIELARRRGERIEDEGERRGGDTKVTQRVTLMSDADKMQRSRDRAIANEPEAVKMFVAREAKAGRVPSMRGAIKAATVARATHAPARLAKQIEATQARKSEFDEHVFATITMIADGVRRTDDQVAKLTGYQTASFLQRIRLIPWLHIDRTPEGLVFHIDNQLRAICEGATPRPELSYTSIAAYLRSLRDEITRRRKENHDEFRKRRWNSELILKREQTSLLDWIEEQLDRIPQL